MLGGPLRRPDAATGSVPVDVNVAMGDPVRIVHAQARAFLPFGPSRPLSPPTAARR